MCPGLDLPGCWVRVGPEKMARFQFQFNLKNLPNGLSKLNFLRVSRHMASSGSTAVNSHKKLRIRPLATAHGQDRRLSEKPQRPWAPQDRITHRYVDIHCYISTVQPKDDKNTLFSIRDQYVPSITIALWLPIRVGKASKRTASMPQHSSVSNHSLVKAFMLAKSAHWLIDILVIWLS